VQSLTHLMPIIVIPQRRTVPDISHLCCVCTTNCCQQHNHGTENDPEFKHYTGNEDPKGFMNIGFVSDNLEASCLLALDTSITIYHIAVCNC
jgi:hypothetical protein